MTSINRRLFLRNTSAAGILAAASTLPTIATATNLVLSPDDRIDAALAEIVIALRERYPDCPIRIDDIHNQNSGCLTIITHCARDKPRTVNHRRYGSASKPKVYFDDGSPLLADDVTGTTAFADWEAKRCR